MCPAYGPTFDSATSRSRSCTTTNAQRCWFLELCARRAGARGSGRGRPARWAGLRTGGPRACRGRRPRRSWLAPRGGCRPGAGPVPGVAADSRPGSAGCGPAWRCVGRRRSRARLRRPPGVSSRADESFGVGESDCAGTASAIAAASSGASGPPRLRARNPTMAARYAGILVQPGVAAARDDERLRDRTRPRGTAGRGEAGEVGGRDDAVVRCHAPAAPARRCRGRARVALTDATVWPRGLQVDPGREPGERPRDGTRDRQVGEPERLAGEAAADRRGRRPR